MALAGESPRQDSALHRLLSRIIDVKASEVPALA
jgi:hypothetical protein